MSYTFTALPDCDWSTACSADGTIIVGNTPDYVAAYWQNGNLTVLDTDPGIESYAYGVSADGAIIVGDHDYYPCYWVRATNTRVDLLVDAAQQYGAAFECSEDGSVIVGRAWPTGSTLGDPLRACKWVNGAHSALAHPVDAHAGYDTSAFSVSLDGNVIVGNYSDVADISKKQFCVWDGASAAADLGWYQQYSLYDDSVKLSNDGIRVVGFNDLTVPQLWVSGSGAQALPLPSGATQARSWTCSGDGLRAYGSGFGAYADKLLIWQLDNNRVDAFSDPAWGSDVGVYNTSYDGRVLVGYANSQSGYFLADPFWSSKVFCVET